jgi:hypothetical protein
MSHTTAGPEPVSLHVVLADWAEGTADAEDNEGQGITATAGDATWTVTGVSGAAWTTPGGDFAPNASATLEFNKPRLEYTWVSNDALVADVQGWLDDPAANFGWLMLGNESKDRTTKRFDSLQNISGFPEPQLPQLTVAFVAPGGAVPLAQASAPQQASAALVAGTASDGGGEDPAY